jgi:glycosyltransferase involved in cell wall biosynthesis
MITVIIPVLNAMPYLPEALASLEAQTFRDFEVSFWDNGSADGSVEEARRWIPSRLPGRVVTGRPLPLHECLATMVEESRTEFVARMDGDDVCMPQRFEFQFRRLVSDNELAAIGSQRCEIDARGNLMQEPCPQPEPFYKILSKLLVVNALLHPTVMFRRAAILNAGNYGLCEKPCEDFDLWLRVAKRYKIENSVEVLLKYRVHEAGIIQSAKRAGDLERPNIECLKLHVNSLFGIKADRYQALRYKRVPFSLPDLLRAAGKISLRTGVSANEVLCSEEFLWSSRCLTARKDYASRALWGFVERILKNG